MAVWMAPPVVCVCVDQNQNAGYTSKQTNKSKIEIQRKTENITGQAIDRENTRVWGGVAGVG